MPADLGLLAEPLFAEEDHEHQTAHVVGGEQCGDEADCPERGVGVPGEEQDLVLGEEAGEWRDPGDRQPPDDERGRSDRQVLAQTAHAAHVLLTVQSVDDRACPEEEQRLEEGVGDHVEDGGDVGAASDRKEHVPELADRGIGKNLLDVVLGDRDRGREQRSEHADPGDHVGRPRVRRGEKRVDPDHEIDARCDHRGGMDECRYRRGTGHGVGQPDVQRYLRRLADRTDEEQQRDGGRRNRGDGADVRLLQHDRVAEGAHGGDGEEDRQHEAPVTHAVGDEGLLARRGVGLVGEPERDEEVGAGADALPTEERHEHVVAQHQHEHREHEQVHVDEEPGEAGIAVHVPDRVQMDQRPHPGDEQAHGDRQRVN